MEKSSIILLLILAVFTVIIHVIRGATQLECDPYHCVGQQVQYQCNVTGSNVMIWRVINGSVTLGDVTYTTGSTPFSTPVALGSAPEFSTIVSTTFSSPQMIVSSIVFTGQTSINGYTIECDDLGGDNENCPIIIPGIPSSPDNVTIHTDTFTNSSVNISWTESPSPCVTGYRYNISSSALEENIIMESTSNSVMVEGLVPSDDQYYVVVTAIDTANRTSSGSDPVCFIFNVPPSPVITSIISTADTVITDNVTVSWRKNSYEVSSDVIVPVIVSFTVNINSLSGDYYEDSSMDLSPETTDYTFNGVQKGRNYSVEVFAKNNIGSSVAIKFHSVPNCICPLQSMLAVTTTIKTQQSCSSSKLINGCSVQSTFTITSASNAITTATTSSPNDNDNDIKSGLSSSVSAGISVAITVPVTAVITAIITVIILYLYQRRVNKQSSNKATPLRTMKSLLLLMR